MCPKFGNELLINHPTKYPVIKLHITGRQNLFYLFLNKMEYRDEKSAHMGTTIVPKEE